MCATKALLAGDADVVSDVYRKRVIARGMSVLDWGVQFKKGSLSNPAPAGMDDRVTK